MQAKPGKTRSVRCGRTVRDPIGDLIRTDVAGRQYGRRERQSAVPVHRYGRPFPPADGWHYPTTRWPVRHRSGTVSRNRWPYGAARPTLLWPVGPPRTGGGGLNADPRTCAGVCAMWRPMRYVEADALCGARCAMWSPLRYVEAGQPTTFATLRELRIWSAPVPQVVKTCAPVGSPRRCSVSQMVRRNEYVTALRRSGAPMSRGCRSYACQPSAPARLRCRRSSKRSSTPQCCGPSGWWKVAFQSTCWSAPKDPVARYSSRAYSHRVTQDMVPDQCNRAPPGYGDQPTPPRPIQDRQEKLSCQATMSVRA